MKGQANRTEQFLYSILEPKAITLGFALFHFLSMAVYVWREWQTGGDEADVHLFMIRPTVLLMAALGLWYSKLWSYVVSFHLSAWLAFVMAYSGLSGIARDLGNPMFSVSVMVAWWHELFGEWDVYVEQPPFTFQLFLFSMIACCCLASMSRLLFHCLREEPKGV